jgi:hypothetical protein
MARQFREQLEEEVQLEQARKAQRTATATPPEPPTPAADSVTPRGNGRAPLVTPDTTHRDPASHATASDVTSTDATSTDATATDTTATDATAADATATRPAEAGGTDERRT